MACVRIRITGRVQMVGFRYFTVHHALSLGITGYVRNRVDGSLEVVASGSPGALKDLYTSVSTGPPLAQVEHIEVQEMEKSEHFTTFSIR